MGAARSRSHSGKSCTERAAHSKKTATTSAVTWVAPPFGAPEATCLIEDEPRSPRSVK
jgi:hypothetical protein